MQAASAATVFHVSDVNQAVAFYCDALGFREDFRVGDYVGIALANVAIHLVARGDDDQAAGGGQIYIFCDEVDGFHADLVSKGVAVSGPENTHYGLREIRLSDNDGNRLSFGCDL